METTTQFQEIKMDENFFKNILSFVDKLITELETNGVKIVDKENISIKPYDKKKKTPSQFYLFSMGIDTKNGEKRLSVAINNKGQIMFGILNYDQRKPLKERVIDNFISMEEFNKEFLKIVTDLKK